MMSKAEKIALKVCMCTMRYQYTMPKIMNKMAKHGPKGIIINMGCLLV